MIRFDPACLGTPEAETRLALENGQRLPGPSDLNVKTVIDVGACVGDYTNQAAISFPQAQIYAFEPVESTALLFLKWLATTTLGPRVKFLSYALGAEDGECDFTSALSEPSTSSILAPTRWLYARCPGIAHQTVGRLRVRSLDSIVAQFGLPLEKDIVLKLDVQGAEDQVLRGAKNTLAHVRWIQLELCYDRLYEGQATLRSILDVLEPLGFVFGGTVAQAGNPFSRGAIYGDLVFIRPGA